MPSFIKEIIYKQITIVDVNCEHGCNGDDLHEYIYIRGGSVSTLGTEQSDFHITWHEKQSHHQITPVEDSGQLSYKC